MHITKALNSVTLPDGGVTYEVRKNEDGDRW